MIFTTFPGFSPPQNSHSFSANGSRSLAFTVNGGNINANDTRVDGAGTRNFSATDVILYVPELDAIDTVNVATNSFEADQSAGGAFVNVTVKSGTNACTGQCLKPTRTSTWKPTSGRLTGRPKLPFIDNQFGASAGGPIRKDKLFFFATYEGVRLVQGNVVQGAGADGGDEGWQSVGFPDPIYDPLTANGQRHGADAVCRQNDSSLAHRFGGAGAARYRRLVESESGGYGRLRSVAQLPVPGCQGNSGARRDQLDAKVNWNPNAKLSTYVRVGLQQRRLVQPADFRAARRAGRQSDQHFGRGGRGEGLEQHRIGELRLQPVAAAGRLFRLLPD